VYGAVVCSYDAVSLFYLELYVKLSIYLSIYLSLAINKKLRQQEQTADMRTNELMDCTVGSD
jgi:hypothetical protein